MLVSPEKAMAPHSSTLAWKIPWMEEPGRLQSMGSLRVRHDWATSLSLFTFTHWDTTERLHFHFSLSRTGGGNGNPLQCSCLENPRDGEAWWAAVRGVAQSRTRLKRLSSSSSMLVSHVEPSNFLQFSLNFRIYTILFTWICIYKPSWVSTTLLVDSTRSTSRRPAGIPQQPQGGHVEHRVKMPESLWKGEDGAGRSAAVAVSTASLKECGVEHGTFFFWLWLRNKCQQFLL